VNNYPTPSPSGSQVFYKSGSKKSKILANLIKDELVKLRKENNRSSTPGDYYVLNQTESPAVLIETGFLSNSGDRQLLTNSTYQDNLTKSIREGVVNFFQQELKKGTKDIYDKQKNNNEEGKQKIKVSSKLGIYYIKSDHNRLRLAKSNFIYPTGLYLNNNLIEYNFSEFIALSSINQLLRPPTDLISPLPYGTMLNKVQINKNTIIVDFSQELIDNFNGGAKKEKLIINSIIKTLCSIPNINNAKILIEGKPEQSIGGHIILP
jgi:N-acetylmuramoyl-L-alanine amidase